MDEKINKMNREVYRMWVALLYGYSCFGAMILVFGVTLSFDVAVVIPVSLLAMIPWVVCAVRVIIAIRSVRPLKDRKP